MTSQRIAPEPAAQASRAAPRLDGRTPHRLQDAIAQAIFAAEPADYGLTAHHNMMIDLIEGIADALEASPGFDRLRFASRCGRPSHG